MAAPILERQLIHRPLSSKHSGRERSSMATIASSAIIYFLLLHSVSILRRTCLLALGRTRTFLLWNISRSTVPIVVSLRANTKNFVFSYHKSARLTYQPKLSANIASKPGTTRIFEHGPISPTGTWARRRCVSDVSNGRLRNMEKRYTLSFQIRYNDHLPR